MKHIYIVIMLTIPVYLHAQSVAPRRPFTFDQPPATTRKDLLRLRGKQYGNSDAPAAHESYHIIQQKSNPLVKAG